SSTPARPRRSSGSAACRGSVIPGSPARGPATASTRTASSRGCRWPRRSCSAPRRCAAPPEAAVMRPRLPDWRLAFGEVLHTRLRPVRHAFRYRAFFVRAPLEQLDARAGSWLFGVNRAALVGFRREDHGDGGPLRDWIDRMLRDAGVSADGRVWLHALPRVLGYAFKPVSFWFCHRRDGALMAVIAEVNN